MRADRSTVQGKMLRRFLASLALLLAAASPALATNCGSYSFTLTNGQTADASQVQANFNTILTCANNNLAHNGSNSDITSLSGLTTPLTVPEGGTNLGTLTAHNVILGEGTSSVGFVGPNTTTALALIEVGASSDPIFGVPVLRSYIAGLTLSNDSTNPNTTLDIAAGQAADSTNITIIGLGQTFFKSTGGTWVAGAGSGASPKNGMGTGLTVAQNTWYHVCEIINAGAADVYFDTDAACTANSPASTTSRRRVGSFKTAPASTNILAFVQDGDLFQWAAPTNDVSATNPGTAAVTRTMNTPLGVNTIWVGAAELASAANATFAFFSDLATNDTAPAAGANQIFQVGGAGNAASSYLTVRTNLLSQIRSRLSFSDVNTALNTTSIGWYDTRGRNN